MLDYTPVRRGELSLPDLVAREKLTPDDLRRLTNEMVDRMQALIANCTDADVTFMPSDPDANDTFAQNPDEVELAWTLGHVIVHTTASAEESAYISVELARGVTARAGRSRYETPWQSVTTIAQCRERLEESLRMRLAALEMWPEHPHLDNTYIIREGIPPYNAIARFVGGLRHDDDHLGQIEKIVKQVRGSERLDSV